MNTWIIGDLQGCAESFAALRKKLCFDRTRDTIYLVGDIVNRGPASLETLRWVYQHRDCVFPVLGNHDLHLLWCALGSGVPHGRDTILEILRAPDVDTLIEWLRQQPLARTLEDALIVHAGVHPSWTIEDTIRRAKVAETILQSPDAGAFLNRMRRGEPHTHHEAQIIETLDVLTRMRALHRNDWSLDAHYSGGLPDLPDALIPWFEVPTTHPRPDRIFFGHWAALGVHVHLPYVALDSGCVWGNALTAWHVDNETTVTQAAIDRPVTHTDADVLTQD